MATVEAWRVVREPEVICIGRGVEFAIGVKRNTAVVRASRTAPVAGWHPVKDMPHTEVAVIDYLPGSWPEDAGVVCIARRTRIPVGLMPTDPRARKLRTIDKAQQALALEGKLDHVLSYSFILTNLDVSTPAKLVEVEHWYRHRNADVAVMPMSGRDVLGGWVIGPAGSA